MINFKELTVLISAVVSGGARSLADGKFAITDIVNFIPAFVAGEAGIAGIGQIPTELAVAPAADKYGATKSFGDSLKADLPADDADDLGAILHGVTGVIAIVSRRAEDETLEKVAAALNAPRAQKTTTWTAADLKALIG